MYKRWEPQKDRFSAKQMLRWLKKAKTWQLLLVLVLTAFIAATFLRLNNIGMIHQRDAVLKADKELSDKKAKQEIIKLQNYVSSHMNSDMGRGIILENIYQRDYDKAINSAIDGHNTNSDAYQKAAIECRSRFKGGRESFRNDYVTCVEGIVGALPENQQTANVPLLENYHYNFASPLISFDIAGLSVVLAGILISFILLRLIALYTLKFVIKRRAKQL